MESHDDKILFLEHAYKTVRPLLLTIEQFRPFCDREQGLHFPAKYHDQAIEAAEALIGKEYHQIAPLNAGRKQTFRIEVCR